MPDPITLSRPRRADHEPDPLPSSAPPPPREQRTAPPTSRAATARHDEDLAAFVANARGGAASNVGSAPAEARPPKPNDGILYVGMNDESFTKEANALASTGASITSIARQDGASITFEGTTYDLTKEGACRRFAGALAAKHNLPRETATKIGNAIASMQPPGGRDELAQIATVFARGEAGGSIPSRIVLSGHSTGSDMHMGSESLQLDSVRALARAMPNAARQIEDIHFSGCMTAKQATDNHQWREDFPNVKSLWAYSGYAPSSPTGHLKAWEASTRGRAEGDPNRGIHGVMTWSARGGLREIGAVPLPRLRELQRGADERYAGFTTGKDRVHGPEEVRIHQDYETYRRLAGHPQLSQEERRHFEARANALFFVRFYEHSARKELAKEHGAVAAAGFRSLGLAEPDFAVLSREDALARIAELDRAIAGAKTVPPAAAEAARVLRGVATFEAPGLRLSWCY